jgi:single-strand DNA-binding protein
MSSVNSVHILGRLGKDPELRHTPGGMAVCEFSVATDHKKKGGEKITEWHSVIVWDKSAENSALYLRKGSKVFIEGRLQTRSWDDKESGKKRYKTEIVANGVTFLDSKEDGERRREPGEDSEPYRPARRDALSDFPGGEDDLQF